MDMPPEAARRIAQDHVVWLTTVTDRGIPAPNPVWFVAEGDDVVVFSEPGSRKVHNIEQRPRVTLHFNSDPAGGDIVVVTGEAELTHDQALHGLPGYVDKYGSSITEELGTTPEELARSYSTEIRIRPARVRLTPG